MPPRRLPGKHPGDCGGARGSSRQQSPSGDSRTIYPVVGGDRAWRGFAGSDKPVADLGNGLNSVASAELLGDVAQPGDDAVDCIFADHPAVPTAVDEFVTSDDRAAGARERHQDLHHARLQRFAMPGIAHLTGCRLDPQSAEDERKFVGKHDSSRDRQSVVFVFPHALEIYRESG